MTITQLRYIIAVKNYGTFAKAAEKCHVAQPTLSLQIKKLEQEIGVELFNRQSSPITLTEAGSQYLKQAESVLAETSRLELIFKKKGPIQGQIRLGVIPTIGAYLLPQIIRQLRENYPLVEFFFQEASTRQLMKMLEQDQIDLGIAATPIENNSFQEKTLYYEPFVLYSSEENAEDQHIDTEKLKEFPLLVLTSENCFRGQVLKICPRSGETRIECSSLETIIGLVDANVGITLIPEIYANENKKLNPKKISSLHGEVPAREVSFIYSSGFYKNDILDAIQSVILDYIPQEYQSQQGKSILGVDLK